MRASSKNSGFAASARLLASFILLLLLLGATNAWAQNTIERENAKPGTLEWQITNLKTDFEWRTDDPALAPYPEIEGYASQTSVNRGGTISFFVNTPEPSFTLAIYRIGWYGGAGGRQVWPATGGAVSLPGTRQPIPAVDPAIGVAECNWTESYRVTVPQTTDKTDWASGIYVVKLTGAASGKQSYITFVVRDDASTSDYLFQSAVTTSQAYNPWGGNSLYGFNSKNNVQARKVSFNRPYAHEHTQPDTYPYKTDGTRFGAGLLFEWEIDMVRFLEREGYDVSYLTSIDVHANANLLRSHKAFLSAGHDEYWTYAMKSAVQAAQAGGVHAGFFGANVSYWQIRLEASATGQAHRTIVGYKEAAQCCDPFAKDGDKSNDRFITTRFRDLRAVFGVIDAVAQPENALVGVMYHGDPFMGDIVVSDAGHWVYAGTGLSNGSRLTGLLGYETDAVFDNGYSPAGIRVVADSPDAWGRSSMTVTTAASGALTFATGSMQWNWGLDDYANPCGSGCLSTAAQGVTRNVLARFALPPLLAPANVSATASDGQVNLTWTDVAGATSYNVYRALASGAEGGTPYKTGLASAMFADTGLVNGTTYYYQVSAVNGSAESALSGETAAKPAGAATAPAAPTSLKASVAGRNIKLSWIQSASGDISGNKVYRATAAGGPFTNIATLGPSTSYNDSAHVARLTYFYVVTAINSSGLESPYSNMVSQASK